MPGKLKIKTANMNRRILIVLAVFLLIVILLAIRLADIQIINAAFYQEKALSQWKRDKLLAAKRGKILDTNGIVLAQSGTALTVIALPKQISAQNRPDVARKLADILQLNYDDILRKISNQLVEQVNIKRQVTDDEAQRIEEMRISGVDFVIETRRNYPLSSLGEQLLGYTDVDGNGQEGLEARYNKYLSGTDGKTIMETDSWGREIPNGAEQSVEAENGCDIVLTIDVVVQSFLKNALEDAYAVNNAKSAQGIVMDVKTGAVLAMETIPSFDPNEPPRTDADALNSLSRNRVIADTYEPGSTFKIITLAAGLEAGVVTENNTFICNQGRIIDGERIKCWSSNHTTSQTLAEGVQHSCNPVFMDIAMWLGLDRFYEYIVAFGFGDTTGIKLTGESSGIVRNAKYVRNVDLARIGFGQSISVTPMQLATAVSAAVNGGKLMQPYVVDEIVAEDGTVIEKTEPQIVRQVISEESSRLVAQMLEGVVRDGSGRNAYIPGYRVGGKTGTAQKYENGQIAQGKYVASFLGFAPSDDPQYLVLILVDEPNITSQVFGSTVAAPFVRSVLYDTLKHYNMQPVYDESESGVRLDVEMPDLLGLPLESAKQVLSQYNMPIEADGSGSVVNQVPQAGTIVPERTGVLLYMSEPNVDPVEPEENVVVPNLSNLTLAKAYAKLESVGLNAEVVGDTLGVVVMQSPVFGATVPPGTTVTITMKTPGE